MGRLFHLFVLQKFAHRSYAYVGEIRPTVDVSSTRTIESLEEAVRGHLGSHEEFRSWGKSVDGIDFVVHKNPQGLNKSRLLEVANNGELKEDNTVLETLGDSPELIFVFDSLSFRFVLFQTIDSSHLCLAVKRTTAPPGRNIHVLKKAAQDHVKLCLGSGAGVDVRVWEQTFGLSDKLTGQSRTHLDGLARGGHIVENCIECLPICMLEDMEHPGHLIITFTLQFGLVLFETGPSSYPYIWSGRVAGLPEGPIEVIERAATQFAKAVLSMEIDSAVELSVDRVDIYEPKPSYAEAYEKSLEELEGLSLSRDKLAWTGGFVTPLAIGIPPRKILSENLIVTCVVTRHRKLRFDYVFFERKPQTFEFVGHGSVETSSGQSAQVIWDAVRRRIESHPMHCMNTGHRIQVYEPTRSFVDAYGKTAMDLRDLGLKEQHLRGSAECVMFSPEEGFSGTNGGQVLIVVFDLPPRPRPTLSEMFQRLRIANEAPSKVSKPDNYQTLQEQSQQRILDDRPRADRFLPPISLLYDGFGVFNDVIQGRFPVLGEDSILEVELWDKVNAFANQMAGFYDTEAERRGTVLGHLGRIFRARRDPRAVGGSTKASKIGGLQIISDGHLDGAHGAMVFCIECKNELSGISCEPSAELVSYVASSFKEQLDGEHRALFHGWRVPALGMTQIGAFVQFFGIVMLTPNMRIVPLTPMLPLATPLDDELPRRVLFLAFKAASIVLAKIQADVSKHVQETPPEIPLELRGLPSVTGVPAIESSSPRINFTLLGRYDTTAEYRNLYHARQLTPTKDIYVKFTQRYSTELHGFCATEGLAPELLGFERLPGGWFVLAMEKVDIVSPWEMESFPELDNWKKDILGLVESFHRKGLVHGDLRLTNFIFTKSSPCRMLLVDFDWGGETAKVCFPRGELAEGLRVWGDQDQRLDQPITEGDDNRVLAETFKLLDQLAAGALERG